ncbi:hypothetical protein [Solemya elarraichensis gill symbiont]|uniref:hypothetical protein n=1 Tax=Solemya elarraichensis gill symbiont TaxID=1918949 RepID=UPI001FE40FE7|nr:hypothetical protein [Solemya elarraichensis gill symbiont]
MFDALATKRPYKEAWTDEKALAMLENESGKHFDPECVKAFFNRLDNIFQIRSDLKDD